MRKIQITDYAKHNSKYGEVRELPWEEFATELQQHVQLGELEDTHDSKKLNFRKSHRGFIAGPVDDTGLRKNENILGWDVLCADVDNASEKQMDAVLEFHHKYASVLYTTHKNGALCLEPDERWRVRLVVLMDQTIPTARTLEAWNRLNCVLGNAVDRKTKNIGRLNFYPSSYATNNEESCWASLSDSDKPLALQDLPPIAKAGNLSVVSDTASQALAFLAKKVRALADEDPTKTLMTSFMRGERIAAVGGRHEAILKITNKLAQWCPKLVEDELLGLFAGSLQAHNEDTHAIEHSEIVNGYNGAVEWLREKLTKGIKLLTDEELNTLADTNGWAVEDVPDRAVIMHEESFFFLCPDGSFEGPYTNRPASVRFVKALAPFPVELYTPTANGGYTRRQFLDVCQDHAWVARQLISDLRIERTYIDADTNTIYEATATRVITEPRYDEGIAKYLELLSGGGADYEKLQDWLSFVYQLDKRLCALLVWGSSGAGKSFLANSLAYMYGGAPSNGREVLAGKFGDSLAARPIVFADEKLEGDRAHQDMTARTREFLGTEERMLQRKGRSTVPLFGNPRLILAANNTSILESRHSMTRDDIKAQAVRFFAVHASNKSKTYLEGVPEATRKHWKERGVAQHVLWLEQNRTVQNPGKRFAVDGDTLNIAQELAFNNNWIALVTQAIAKGLLHHLFKNNNLTGVTGEIVVRKKRLLVRVEGVTAAWEFIKDNTRDVPERAEIKKVLRDFFAESDAVVVKWAGSTKRYYPVNIDEFLASASNLDFDTEELRKVLSVDSKPSNKIGDK